MNMVLSARAGRAPRLLAGWEAMEELLDGGDWVARTDLHAAATATGLATKTVENLLGDGVRIGVLESEGRAATRRWRFTP